MRRNKLLVYLILSFSLTWISWWLLAWLTQTGDLQYGAPVFMALFGIGGLGPTVAPFVTSLITDGKKGLRQYGGIAFKWRISICWYFGAVFIFLVSRFAAIGISGFFDLQFSVDYQPWFQFFPIFLIMIIGGGLEEFGWRGMALPELLKKTSPLTSTIIVGFIWSLWHLPLFYVIGSLQSRDNFVGFTYHTMALSFVLTWLFVKTKSVIIPLAAHAASNTINEIAAISGPGNVSAIDDSIRLILGLVLVFIFQRRNECRSI